MKFYIGVTQRKVMTGGDTYWDELAWTCLGLSACTIWNQQIGPQLCKIFESLYNLISFQSMVAHLSICCESKLCDSPGLYRCGRRQRWLPAVQVLHENRKTWTEFENLQLGSQTPEWETVQTLKDTICFHLMHNLMSFKGLFPYLY